MTRRCYHRALLIVIVASGIASATGVALLIAGLTTPGILCFVGGILIGTVAGMEWRCRERPVVATTMTSPIVVVIGEPEPIYPLRIK